MATRIITLCDGCGEETDLAQPHLIVNCNLHVFHEVDPLNPNNPHGRITTGGVVSLTFDKPACASKWFKDNEGGKEFVLEEPEVPVAVHPYAPDTAQSDALADTPE